MPLCHDWKTCNFKFLGDLFYYVLLRGLAHDRAVVMAGKRTGGAGQMKNQIIKYAFLCPLFTPTCKWFPQSASCFEECV